MQGTLQLVVLGKEIGNCKKDLTAKNAKACDSTKSPLILKSSINLKLILEERFFLIFFINNLFFLPPPQTNMF